MMELIRLEPDSSELDRTPPRYSRRKQSQGRFGQGPQRSLQLHVLRFGFLKNGDARVGVFPEGEEIFVGGE